MTPRTFHTRSIRLNMYEILLTPAHDRGNAYIQSSCPAARGPILVAFRSMCRCARCLAANSSQVNARTRKHCTVEFGSIRLTLERTTQKGDILLEIEGVAVEQCMPEELMPVCQGPEGSSCAAVFRRPGPDKCSITPPFKVHTIYSTLLHKSGRFSRLQRLVLVPAQTNMPISLRVSSMRGQGPHSPPR